MGKKETFSCGLLVTIKCKMNDRIRKTLLSNHHSNHSYRQGSSMNVKPNG